MACHRNSTIRELNKGHIKKKDITFLKILAEISTLLEKLLKMSLAVEDSIHGWVVAHLPCAELFSIVEYHLSQLRSQKNKQKKTQWKATKY